MGGGVVVSFPRAGVESDKVTLKGSKNCIQAAIDRIQEIVKDLEDQVTIDCEIEQAYHRTVMGAKGSKVQKITTDFNVQIKFPDKAVENGGQEEVNGEGRSTNPNIIKITGKKDNCEGASKALLELVPITAEVSVPFSKLIDAAASMPRAYGYAPADSDLYKTDADKDAARQKMFDSMDLK